MADKTGQTLDRGFLRCDRRLVVDVL